MNMSVRIAPLTGLPLVCIVDGDPHVSKAVARLLEVSGFNARCWPDAEGFLADIGPEQPGCLLLDLCLQGRSGLDLLGALPGHRICLPTIILTGHVDVATAVHAMKLGAFDLLQKPPRRSLLIDRVRAALELDAERHRHQTWMQQLCERRAQLSRREREVLHHVLNGQRNKVIAAELGIGVSTVEIHRHRMMEKLEVHSIAELVRLYAELPP